MGDLLIWMSSLISEEKKDCEYPMNEYSMQEYLIQNIHRAKYIFSLQNVRYLEVEFNNKFISLIKARQLDSKSILRDLISGINKLSNTISKFLVFLNNIYQYIYRLTDD